MKKNEILSSIVSIITGAFLVFLSVAGLIVVLGLLWAIPTMLLWDWLMPEIFDLPKITILQAWGINILAGILFKNKGTKKTETNKKTGSKKIILS